MVMEREWDEGWDPKYTWVAEHLWTGRVVYGIKREGRPGMLAEGFCTEEEFNMNLVRRLYDKVVN